MGKTMTRSGSILILLVLATILPGCGGKDGTPLNYAGAQLHFGQGGGFTGEVNYFVLLDNGLLFEKDTGDSTYILRDTWKKRVTRQIFKEYNELEIQKISHQHPGNLYYFIEFQTPDQPPHLITWGQQGYPPGDHVIQFYQILYQSTRSKS
jgi:hypothetical protein